MKVKSIAKVYILWKYLYMQIWERYLRSNNSKILFEFYDLDHLWRTSEHLLHFIFSRNEYLETSFSKHFFSKRVPRNELFKTFIFLETSISKRAFQNINFFSKRVSRNELLKKLIFSPNEYLERSFWLNFVSMMKFIRVM